MLEKPRKPPYVTEGEQKIRLLFALTFPDGHLEAGEAFSLEQAITQKREAYRRAGRKFPELSEMSGKEISLAEYRQLFGTNEANNQKASKPTINAEFKQGGLFGDTRPIAYGNED